MSATTATDDASGRERRKSKNAFRTISEVADALDIPQHVLRFWETKFSQIKPMKRGGGRRYYRPEDVEILKVIQHHLYKDGYTIRGVQKLFREKGLRNAIDEWAAENGNGSIASESSDTDSYGEADCAPVSTVSERSTDEIAAILTELKELRKSLD